MKMSIEENILLAEHTTFKIGGPAAFFCAVSTETALVEAVGFAKEKKLPLFILGGGSNIIVSDKGFSGLVVKMEIGGIEEQGEGSKEKGAGRKEKTRAPSSPLPAPVLITAGAGESWDGFVDWTVERGLYGLENLSAIPGTVGAAPVQNIGAYGAEAARVVSRVRALDTRTMRFVGLSNADCAFGYRDSVFKRERGRYVITRVDFNLSKNGTVNVAYKDLRDYFAGKDPSAGKKAASPTLKQVREAVIDIRSHKLPDWKLWGTAGSFFKNPIVTAAEFAGLEERHPGLPGFPEADGRVKVSLGWILDKVCGAKGLCMGKACVYQKQALVLVTLPGATALEVFGLSRELMKRVRERTGLEIEGEVEWVN